MSRPPIPADISRRALVEAGHRCAIPTCRNPDVDLHHIVPWERCKSHDFDNLIALCPNCHRRAHNGEIDRKSLLLYKLQLSAFSGFVPGAKSIPAPGVIANPLWSINKFSERIDAPNPYEAVVEFPQFMPSEGELDEINTLIRADAINLIQSARSHSLSDPPSFDEWWSKLDNVYAASYEVLLFERNFISLKYVQYRYGAGAAHGNSVAIDYNYRLGPLVRLHGPYLFRDGIAALDILSEYCIKVIEAENRETAPNNWVRRGCGPEWGNFDCLNLLRDGILVTFREYQVGPYAEGKRTVFVPSHELLTLVHPRSGIIDLWT